MEKENKKALPGRAELFNRTELLKKTKEVRETKDIAEVVNLLRSEKWVAIYAYDDGAILLIRPW